jgi:D-beta-D-heptose 7-phosphate kinase/D-beta-D-heptose 1-phosphate adenosyltransferase
MFNHAQYLHAIDCQFGRADVLVVGDLMVDCYLFGQIQRISPEASVPILKQNSRRENPGGAANVSLNLARLGFNVQVLGVVGDDAEGSLLLKCVQSEDLSLNGIIRVPDRPTTTKTRLVCGRHQLLRIDVEELGPLLESVSDELLQLSLKALPTVAAVVVSDYAKGVVGPELARQLIAAARQRGIPVIVDPKGSSWDKYVGATLVTPNRSELGEATGESVEDLEKLLTAGEKLRRTLHIDCLAVTLGERGIVALDDAGRREFPSEAREVFDVSGAGDTVVAAATAALVGGLGIDDALRFANVAAGLVVGRFGTVPIDRQELRAALDRTSPANLESKICSLENAIGRVRHWQARGDKIVFTNGCFDLVHAGHILHLAKARQLGDRLIIGLNSDSSIRGLKGPDRPIQGEKERAILLAGLGSVDAVVIFQDPTPLDLIVALCPDVLVKGDDYLPQNIAGAREVESWGGQVVTLPLVPGHSTSAIVKRIRESNL